MRNITDELVQYFFEAEALRSLNKEDKNEIGKELKEVLKILSSKKSPSHS